MAEKLYHSQPCFCMPCRALRKAGDIPQQSAKLPDDEQPKKSKRRKKP
jgi:hypothetical protein